MCAKRGKEGSAKYVNATIFLLYDEKERALKFCNIVLLMGIHNDFIDV